MSSLNHKLENLLLAKKEINKKQVALFLKPDQIDALDNIVNEMSSMSDFKINRNFLIELAVEDLIECANEIINNHKYTHKEKFDTIICPAQYSGLNFLKNNKRWEFVKLDSNKIKDLKYLVLYVGKPKSSLVCWAKIKSLKEIIINNQKKYIIYIHDDIQYFSPEIPLGDLSALYVRSVRYTTLDKVKRAKQYKDILI